MARRRYDEHTKLRIIAAADLSSITAASETSGVAGSTIRRWLDDPKYAEVRAKTREDLADEFKAIAHLGLAVLRQRLEAGEIETRDLVPVVGVAVDKSQLLTGAATSRSESRALTDDLSDTEKQRLRDWIDRVSPTLTAPGTPV
jgi:transposase-like protein